MIGNFARIVRAPFRALPMEDTTESEARGTPPERFVEKISEDGGDVYLAPVLDTLRAALRRHFQATPAEPQARTPDADAEECP